MLSKFENPWDPESYKKSGKGRTSEKEVGKEDDKEMDNADSDKKNEKSRSFPIDLEKLLESFGIKVSKGGNSGQAGKNSSSGSGNKGSDNNSNNGNKNKKNSNKNIFGLNKQNNGNNIFPVDKRFILYVFIGIIMVWLASGFYIIDINEEGVVTRFGKYVRTATRGLNYKLPQPIEDVDKINVTRINKETIGVKLSNYDVNVQNQNSVSKSWLNKMKQSNDQDKSASDRSNSTYGASFLASANNNRSGVNSSSSQAYNAQQIQQNKLYADRNDEDQMLTGDENMIDVQFFVQWYIDNPKAYLFNIKDDLVDGTVRVVAESAMREVIGSVKLYDALSEKREDIESKVKEIIQKTLDSYDAGIKITAVGILYSYVAPEVMDAYRDVQSSKADKEREINEAYSYRNSLIPRARGETQAILESAAAYHDASIAVAKGDAARFTSVLSAYKNSKDVVRNKLYIDTMEKVFSGIDKVLLDSKISTSSTNGQNSNNVIPVLSVNELMKKNKSQSDGVITTNDGNNSNVVSNSVNNNRINSEVVSSTNGTNQSKNDGGDVGAKSRVSTNTMTNGGSNSEVSISSKNNGYIQQQMLQVGGGEGR